MVRFLLPVLCALVTSCADPRSETLAINEFMPRNSTACPDVDGTNPDWVELANLGGDVMSLDGLTVSDDRAEPGKHALGGLTIPAGGFLVLFADGTVDGPPERLPFRLSGSGEEFVVFSGRTILAEVTWSPSVADTAFSRLGDTFVPCPPTCGAENDPSCQ